MQETEQETQFLELIEEERDDAFERGREAGEKIGYEKAKHEFGATLKLLQTISHKMLEEKKQLLETIKPEIIEFSFAVCEKVLRAELAQPEKLARLIDSLIALVSPSLQGEVVKIGFAAEDLIMLEKHLSHISYDKNEIKTLRFFADPIIARGDCRIETATSLLHFSLSRELEDLRAKVLRQ